jgi:hypothetical protein
VKHQHSSVSGGRASRVWGRSWHSATGESRCARPMTLQLDGSPYPLPPMHAHADPCALPAGLSAGLPVRRAAASACAGQDCRSVILFHWPAAAQHKQFAHTFMKSSAFHGALGKVLGCCASCFLAARYGGHHCGPSVCTSVCTPARRKNASLRDCSMPPRSNTAMLLMIQACF